MGKYLGSENPVTMMSSDGLQESQTAAKADVALTAPEVGPQAVQPVFANPWDLAALSGAAMRVSLSVHLQDPSGLGRSGPPSSA